MKQEQIISAFTQLGVFLREFSIEQSWKGFESGLSEQEFNSFLSVVNKEPILNPWFTKNNVISSLQGISNILNEDDLNAFCSKYSFSENPKRIGIVMAGNLPLVGFHDMLCVILSGNIAVCKLSSSDQRLPLAIVKLLVLWQPDIKDRLEIAMGPMKNFEAVIATGSDNSALHFEQYFGKYPHIFRKNRTSIAVLTGEESAHELQGLGRDCFQYFGMGCRNVSKIFVPKDFDLNKVFESFKDFHDIINHHKYANNYDYHRTIYLMNSEMFLDNNCMLLKENDGLHAPLSVIYYSRYNNIAEVERFIADHKEEIQVVVGKNYTVIGTAQSPKINDFADNVDTMEWLNNLA